jgi:hypothetical protein
MLNARFAACPALLRGPHTSFALRYRENIKNLKNPYIVDVFRCVEKIRASRCALAPRNASCASCALVNTQHVVSMRVRTRSIVQKHWFFCRAVVIRKECSRSPRALYDIATHSWLGGQHGEEAKIILEDESGEKGRLQEDEGQVPPEEEVATRCFPVFDCVRRR